MSSTLRLNKDFFRSLNCAKCEKPFSTATSRAPRSIWFEKLRYICCECFDCEKAKKQEERWKPIDDVQFNQFPVEFLLDLLADDSLQMNELRTGYIIAKEPFIFLGCPVCFKKYEITDPMKCPFDPHCHHTICIDCYRRMRSDKGPMIPESPDHVYEIVCPICRVSNNTDLTDAQENALKDFLLELPGMIQQYKITKALRVDQSSAQCSTCSKEVEQIDEETDEATANRAYDHKKVPKNLRSQLISELKLRFRESASSVTEMENNDEMIEERD